MSIKGLARITTGALIASVIAATPSAAAEEPTIVLTVWGGDTVGTIVETAIAQNGEQAVLTVLSALAARQANDETGFPGVSGGPEGSAQLAAIAQALRTDRPVPAAIADRTVGGAPTAGLRPGPAATVQPMSMSTAVLLGNKINGGYSWEMNTYVQAISCSIFSCDTNERVDITLRFDPSPKSSRITVKQLHVGQYGHLTGGISYKFYLYLGSTALKSNSVNFGVSSTSGTGVLLQPYASMAKQKGFYFYNLLSTTAPTGRITGEYITGKGSCNAAGTCTW